MIDVAAMIGRRLRNLIFFTVVVAAIVAALCVLFDHLHTEATGQIDEYFEAHCPSPCWANIRAKPVKVRTNATEKILLGKKHMLTVWLTCPRCGRTSQFESEIMDLQPRAYHILKPQLPPRGAELPVPPSPLGTNK